MINKINRILLKLKKDNKSLHQIDISSKYIRDNCNFNHFDGYLSEKGYFSNNLQNFTKCFMKNFNG